MPENKGCDHTMVVRYRDDYVCVDCNQPMEVKPKEDQDD